MTTPTPLAKRIAADADVAAWLQRHNLKFGSTPPPNGGYRIACRTGDEA